MASAASKEPSQSPSDEFVDFDVNDAYLDDDWAEVAQSIGPSMAAGVAPAKVEAEPDVDHAFVATVPPDEEQQVDRSSGPKSEAEIEREIASIEQFDQNTSSTGTATAAAVANWGWGGAWGGLESLGGKLKEVAAGAVRDVRDLTDTFQQALHDDDRPVPAAATAKAHGNGGNGGSGGGQASAVAAGAELPSSAAPAPATPAEDFAVDEDSARRMMRTPDQLEVGLKAIDDKMEQLATGAARAMSSLWGGLAGAAKSSWTVGQSVAAKVESTTLELANELINNAERGIETFGRTAVELVVGEVPTGGSARSASRQGGAMGFEQCFDLYGGSSTLEELEALGNDCARICNRTRIKLDEAQREALDRSLTQLGPLFDTANDGGADVAAARNRSSTSSSSGGGADEDPLEPLMGPLRATFRRSRAKAQELAKLCEQRAAAAATSAATGADVDATSKPAGGDDDESSKAEPLLGATSAAGAREPTTDERPAGPPAQQLADDAARHAAKGLAELSSSQLQLLLRAGRSVAAPSKLASTQMDIDNLRWPANGVATASLLHTHVQNMTRELQDLAEAYKALIQDLSSLLATEGVRATVDDAKLVADCATAVDKVQEGYRSLLYVVLLSMLMREIA